MTDPQEPSPSVRPGPGTDHHPTVRQDGQVGPPGLRFVQGLCAKSPHLVSHLQQFFPLEPLATPSVPDRTGHCRTVKQIMADRLNTKGPPAPPLAQVRPAVKPAAGRTGSSRQASTSGEAGMGPGAVTTGSALPDGPVESPFSRAVVGHQKGVPVPLVRPARAPGPAAAALPLPLDCSDLLDGLFLSPGAEKVFRVLHNTAVRVVRRLGYAAMPSTVTMHLPQQIVALAAGYTTRHLRRLLKELVVAGLLDWGPHASLVGSMRLWDGCLWAIKVRPVNLVPQLRRDEWRHPWRNFAGDMDTGRTVNALMEGMSQLQPDEREEAVLAALDAWAVNPGTVNLPVMGSADMEPEGKEDTLDVKEIAYRLGELRTVAAPRRERLVGRLAGLLCRALRDKGSLRWYCAVIWQAWRDDVEGRGGLQVLAAALTRLHADRDDWAALRNPAALLVSRLSKARLSSA